MFVSPAYAQSAGGFGSGFGSLVPLLLIVLIMYFLIIRPQMQQAKTHKKMIEDLRRGDQIITQGGLIGKISKIEDEELVIEIAHEVKVRVIRSTIKGLKAKTEPVKGKKYLT